VVDQEDVSIFEIAREDLSCLWQLDRIAGLPAWSPTDYERLYSEQTSLILIAGRPEAAMGFVCGRLVTDEAEILKLVVKEGDRRKGIGGRLVREFLRRAKEQQCRAVYLDVRESNGAALQLYESLGFCVVGRRPGYYRQPEEDALLMAKHSL
jgi:ribosomal-protein-alanine N-acetyltransferase